MSKNKAQLVGCLLLFRKHNIKLMILAGILAFCLEFPVSGLGSSLQAAAQAGEQDEPGRLYIERDAEGHKVFGTDHKAEPAFSLDKDGDRSFRTQENKPQEQEYKGPKNIYVTPEIKLPPATPAGGR